MGSKKKNTTATTGGNLQTIKIGSRVRCTDDGVEGRIVWANGVSAKIEWNDGEKVTWKRDSLATRPIEILDADSDDQTIAAVPTDTAGIAVATEAEQPAAVAEPTATTEQPHVEPETTLTTVEQSQANPETTSATAEPTATEPATPTTEPTTSEPTSLVSEPATEQTTPNSAAEQAPMAAKPKRQRKAPAEPREKKPSAIDAAAKVLAEEGRPLSCKELIGAMALKGYWTSPGGKTPDATLYSAILREIDTRGAEARFAKTERGRFARRS